MDKEEARIIHLDELADFRSMSFQELSSLVGSVIVMEKKGLSGTDYQIEVLVLWDSPRNPGGNLRVIASIDDGRFLSAFNPVTEDFIKGPDGNFIGE